MPSDGPLHDSRTAALLGIALGVAFTVCFVTGLLSRLIQQPPSWFHWPARPTGLYRVTQGVHVATGIATIPLLLAKLWSVYHHFVAWPPARSVVHAVERLALIPLVGGSLFLLASGMNNIAHWYPWSFYFPTAHRTAAWITIGALITHIGAKASTTRRALSRATSGDTATAATGEVGRAGLSRRSFLTSVAATSGLLTVLTVGQTVAPLRRLALLAPRRPDVGPQGVPVNKTAVSARVVELARSSEYLLRVEGAVQSPLALTLDQIRELPSREAVLPISCVEGWSAEGTWRGVSVAHLLEMAGARPGASVRVESLQPRGLWRAADVSPEHAADLDTLLAYDLGCEALHIDHGYPVRLIGPNRPGVMQTKWVARMVVV